MSDTTTVLIVGAGFAGLGTAIRLLQQGIDDFVVLERADEVGGTWRDGGNNGQNDGRRDASGTGQKMESKAPEYRQEKNG